ncbi:MAG: hypothetical protein A2Z25_00665 [Planctomycetes bacterium RBG_16_55_9]|nr:MAG: hypothetical protein A2Z25_00665 [Planctomycetes bacterium RBG_16_55_9]
MHANADRQDALGFGKQDYYQLQAWPVGGAYLGVLSVFYWEEDRVHLELAWSPDTRHWERIDPGRDLTPHGGLGEPGAGCRYAAMRPFVAGNRVRIYYGADDGRHNADKNRAGGLYLSEFAVNRVAGLKGTGVVLTRPLPIEPDVNPHSIRVEADGAITVSIVPAGDHQARLKFELNDAVLYCVTW